MSANNKPSPDSGKKSPNRISPNRILGLTIDHKGFVPDIIKGAGVGAVIGAAGTGAGVRVTIGDRPQDNNSVVVYQMPSQAAGAPAQPAGDDERGQPTPISEAEKREGLAGNSNQPVSVTSVESKPLHVINKDFSALQKLWYGTLSSLPDWGSSQDPLALVKFTTMAGAVAGAGVHVHRRRRGNKPDDGQAEEQEKPATHAEKIAAEAAGKANGNAPSIS